MTIPFPKAFLLPLLFLAGSDLRAEPSGPTPYPDAKAEAAWPHTSPGRSVAAPPIATHASEISGWSRTVTTFRSEVRAP